MRVVRALALALVVVVANAGVCECAFVVHGWCARDVQVSEARVECTFLANDAACLPLVRAVIQLRCCGNVSLGCGLLSCVVRGVSSMEFGFRQSFIPLVSSHSPSCREYCTTLLASRSILCRTM